MRLVRCAACLAPVIVMLVCALAAPRAMAQESDPIAKSLASARVRYESAVQSIRHRVEAALKKAGEAASKDKADPLAAAGRVEAQRKAFAATGAWPDVPEAARLRQEDAKAGAEMEKAYAAALTAYGSAKKPELADAVKAEADRFKGRADIVPWGDNLLAAKSESERTLADRGTVGVEAPALAGSYRIEIKARRTGAAGTLHVLVPVANGKRLDVPALAEDKGAIRVLLTILDGAASADLGAARPLDAAAAKADAGEGVTVRADGGPFLVESVHIKPVAEGEREAVAAREKKPGKGAEPGGADEAAARLTQGSTWSGKWSIVAVGVKDTTVTVAQRSGSTAVLRMPAWDNRGTVVLRVSVRGGSVSVEGIGYEGPVRKTLSQGRGSGSISGDHLQISYSWVYTEGSTRNQPGSGTLDVQAE